jgi:hypothetical protein
VGAIYVEDVGTSSCGTEQRVEMRLEKWRMQDQRVVPDIVEHCLERNIGEHGEKPRRVRNPEGEEFAEA